MEAEATQRELTNLAVNIVLVPLVVYAVVPLAIVVTHIALKSLPPQDGLTSPSFNTWFLSVLFSIVLLTLLFGGFVSWRWWRRAERAETPLEAARQAFFSVTFSAALGMGVALHGTIAAFVTRNPTSAKMFWWLSLMFFWVVWNLLWRGRALIDSWRRRLRLNGVATHSMEVDDNGVGN